MSAVGIFMWAMCLLVSLTIIYRVKKKRCTDRLTALERKVDALEVKAWR